MLKVDVDTVSGVVHAEQVTVQSPDGELLVDVRPSGVIDWSYGTSSGDSSGVEIVLALAAFLANCVGRLAFRGGSTLWVSEVDGKRKRKQRFPRRAAAEEAGHTLVPLLTERGFDALNTAP